LSGAGRNAVDVEASAMRIQDLTVRNYRKKIKSDNVRHRTTESGLRIKASDVEARNVRCEDMVTDIKDSVPRCINIQGGISDILLRNISGRRINGGIVIASSHQVRIEGYDFRDLEDNGLYILPGAVGVVAVDGYLENTNEPVVFKGKDTEVLRLRIHNQGQSFGLENAQGVVLKDVDVTFDDRLVTRPAFIRTRRDNEVSTGIRLQRINASMPMGAAVLALANGSIINMELVDSTFNLDLDLPGTTEAYIVRQPRGEVIRITDTTFKFDGRWAGDVQRLVAKIPPPGNGRLRRKDTGNRFLRRGSSWPVIIRTAKSRD